MYKKISILITTVFTLMLIYSCDSGGSGSQSLSNTKYLASNIILDSISPNRNAYAEEIDTTTRVAAENVIFETKSASQIESDNVQDALEEISLNLSTVMVGTWSIQNYNQETLHDPTGQIVIYDDGTFDLISGSFAAVGMGSGTAESGFCDHTEENQTYIIYAEELAAFTHFNDSAENSTIPRLVKLRENEIIFVGSGGCGEVGRERISILTRVSE